MVNLILGNRFPSDLFICHSFILLFLVVIYKCFLGFLRFPKYLWKFHENVSYEVPIWNMHRKAQTKKRWKPLASISFENTFMLFLLPIFTYSYLFRLGCELFSQYIPQGTCNTYRGVSTTDDTYHQRQCKITDAGHTPDVQRTYHYQRGQGGK